MLSTYKKLQFQLRNQQQSLMLIGFLASLWLFQLALHVRLGPSIETFIRLPYVFNGELKGWDIKSGKWQKNKNGLQQTQATAGLISSPIFLNESGLKLSLELEPGGGINFFAQKRGELAQSQVVYLLPQEQGVSLIAGTIDARGVLNTQAKVIYPASSKLLLTIETQLNSYRLFLNNDLLFDDLPLLYTQGWLSLSSSTETTIYGLIIDKTILTYSDKIVPITQDPSGYTNDFSLPLEREWRILSGNWQVKDGKLWQYISEGFDYTALYPKTFSKYQISSTFLQTERLGAGILFNLPSLESYAGGQLVRLTHSENEEGIFWGFYDNDAQFIGQGYLKLELDKTKAHTLKLEVKEDSFSIYLNDQLLRTGLALQTPEGYLGLTVSESIVAFDELIISPLKD